MKNYAYIIDVYAHDTRPKLNDFQPPKPEGFRVINISEYAVILEWLSAPESYAVEAHEVQFMECGTG
jgi:hypothetical protein